jgi:AcrR family transcriptional regulator
VRGRLQQAALELYRERGYDRTTTAEIAARAGVTERTFFRHFPDKREILFAEDPRLRPALADAVAGAPEGLSPLEILLLTFRSLEQMLKDNRPFTEPRLEIIAKTPALMERAEAKAAAMTAVLATALQRRGVEEKLAILAARAGMAAFSHAASAWREDPSLGLGVHLERAFQTLHGLSAAGAATTR